MYLELLAFTLKISTNINTFGNPNIQYHDFDNNDALTFTDKYTALLQQELQNPYWCLHNPITTISVISVFEPEAGRAVQ